MEILSRIKRFIQLPRRLRERLNLINAELVQLQERISSIETSVTELNERSSRGEKGLSSLQSSLKKTTDFILEDERVDLVNLGDLLLYMYVDDVVYSWVPAGSRHYELTSDDIVHLTENSGTDSSTEITDFDQQVGIVGKIIKHYYAHDLDFVYLDVGCNYGSTALRVASYIKRLGKNNQVICFDPGRVRSLVNYNISVNGMKDLVHFEPLAISSTTCPRILHYQVGHSEDHHLVDRGENPDIFSYVVDSSSIDDYVRDHDINHHLIIKIDTQGAEWEVFQGMKRVMEHAYVSYVMEFTPREIARRLDPVLFLKKVGKDAVILDLSMLDISKVTVDQEGTVRRIEPDDYEEFVEKLSSSAPDWTDLLVIPRNLPDADRLIEAICMTTKSELDSHRQQSVSQTE